MKQNCLIHFMAYLLRYLPCQFPLMCCPAVLMASPANIKLTPWTTSGKPKSGVLSSKVAKSGVLSSKVGIVVWPFME